MKRNSTKSMAIEVSDPKNDAISTFSPKMKPNSANHLNFLRTFLIGFGFCSAMAVWGYYSFKIPLLLQDMISNSFAWKDTVIGIIITSNNIVGVSIQPYFGVLSDCVQSKYGR